MTKKQYKNTSENNQMQFTLDSKHKTFNKQFNQIKKQEPSKTKELNIIIKKISKLDTFEKNDNYLEVRTELILKKEKLENEIKNIKCLKKETDYFQNVHEILNNYYENTPTKPINGNISCNDSNINNIFEENISDNIKSYYNLENDDIPDSLYEESQDNTIESNNKLKNKNINMNDYITTIHSSDKGNLLDEYMLKVDKSYISHNQFNNLQVSLICETCNIEKTILQSEGILICHKCGITESIVIDSEKPSYKEPLQETSYFCYKRINHFNEWLSQFQAKESTEIPEHVYNEIISEIKKLRIVNMSKLTPDKMREILKKHKLNKYYEHVPHIINKLSGLPPPIMNREIEEKLRSMFKEIQEPFLEVCPKERKNFLSYSYVLHKMCELLGLDEFLTCFPLLKSREKLHNQDIMWKQITGKLNWQFIPSI